jgi:HrpA-like RNA helicase
LKHLLVEDPQKWKDKPNDKWYRIIISTNVMESGITLNYLDVVIDSGYEVSVKYNPYMNCEVICNYDLTPQDKTI